MTKERIHYNRNDLESACIEMLGQDAFDAMIKARIALPTILDIAIREAFVHVILDRFNISYWKFKIMAQAAKDLAVGSGHFVYHEDGYWNQFNGK